MYDNRLHQYLYIDEIIFFQKHIILIHRQEKHCDSFLWVIRDGQY